jgi:uncharacterized membrane protein
VLWANLHLLFLSLIPFVTGRMGENSFAEIPTAVYGGVLLMAAIAFRILQRAILAVEGRDSLLAAAVSHDVKGNLSPLLYVAAIIGALIQPWIAGALYVAVALLWLVPDRRIERAVADERRRREDE